MSTTPSKGQMRRYAAQKKALQNNFVVHYISTTPGNVFAAKKLFDNNNPGGGSVASKFKRIKSNRSSASK